MRTAWLVSAVARLGTGDPIDVAVARARFEEARTLSGSDGGALWGRPLYGPMLFADPATRACVANQADAEGRLAERAGVFEGTLPADVNVANTAVRWAGVEWTLVKWPLAEEATERKRLLAHELFHRIQDDLGLPLGNPSNAHLDTEEGRVSMRLELRALAAALDAAGAKRREAIEDALLFRASRRARFPGADAEERALEMNEGLAEYTGVRLCGASDADRARLLAEALDAAATKPSFVRSFAYATGPAYGLLLDEAGASWRKGLTPEHDLSAILRKTLSISPPADPAKSAEGRRAQYGGEAIVAAESQRESVRRKRESDYRARLIEGPVLVLRPGAKFSYSFDPSQAVALQGVGTVYASLRVTDAWGVLEASRGALLVQDKGAIVRVQVPAPADRAAQPLEGDGWQLELRKGWALVDGAREGDLVVAAR